MALSTTQSIWRSGGGDQTRTAYCGTGLMAAQFYIADASPASAANVKVSSASGAPDLVLPNGAVVTSISIVSEDGGAGTCDIGYVLYSDTTTGSSNYIADGLSAAAVGTTSVGSVVSGAALPGMAYVTVSDNTSGAGALSGFVTYFVTDPLVGQQNV